MTLVYAICLFFLVIWPVGVSAEDYVIGDGDTLQISVWGEPAVSTGARVRPDGKITLPAIGDIIATGFTPMALSEKLSQKLSEIIKKPIVTVAVTGITNSKIYVFGGGVAVLASNAAVGENTATPGTAQSILTSGVYSMPARTTLLKFLAGLGLLRTADLERAYILRDGKKLNVNFYDLFMKADLSKDIMLKSEDMIFVPDNIHNKIYVMGAVNNPRYIIYWNGIRILDVILEAGGFAKFAKENSVLIIRKATTEEPMKELKLTVRVEDLMKDGDLSQNIPLMPGDFIIVKESIF